jgi:oxygen-independent coproporphyrinogen III oxidase
MAQPKPELAKKSLYEFKPHLAALQALAVPDGSSVDALYLHVPFCFHKCHYCDFYSVVPPEESARRAAGRLVERILEEAGYWAGRLSMRPRTVFVGGGTPTLLAPEELRRLLGGLRELGVMAQVEEFTVEANPETVTEKILEVLAAGGVNRLSMGAQTFQPRLLKTLERWHEPASVGRAVRLARAAGFKQLNLDLIIGIPGQTMAELEDDLSRAIDLSPEHLSCYELTYEAGTPLTGKAARGEITPVDEETQRGMYERVIERLAEAGYEHYEISNWAKPGCRCQHNLAYWQNLNWLGLGPSAASHVDGWRWKNRADVEAYLTSEGEPPTVDEERLDVDRAIGERMMLGLRLREGLALKWVEENVPDGSDRARAIEELVGMGLLEKTRTQLRLSREGLFVADSVIGRLI